MITHDIAEASCLSDKVVIFSKRPATVKNIYTIDYAERTSPIGNRQCPEFAYYYDKIWRDLDEAI